MFGSLGGPELIFILIVALLIFGPRKLPEIGRTLGKGLGEFRRATNELKRTLNAEMIEDELRQSDPRRILKDEIDKSVRVSGEPVAGDGAAEAAEQGEAPAADGPVARGQLDAAATAGAEGAGIEAETADGETS